MTAPSELAVEAIREVWCKDRGQTHSYDDHGTIHGRDIHTLLAHLDTLTEGLREATETVARLQDMLDKDFYGPKGEVVVALQEALAGAHAIRCACLPTPDGRDPRCVELQGVAGVLPADSDPDPDPLAAFRPNLQR